MTSPDTGRNQEVLYLTPSSATKMPANNMGTAAA
jgi:hypothetical protein